MDRKAIREAIKKATGQLELKSLSPQELGLDALLDIAQKSEVIERITKTVLLGPIKGKAVPEFFGKMDLGGFQSWIEKLLKEKIREIICSQLYPEIDTEEERQALIDKYDDKIVDALIQSYPVLAPGRPIIKQVVRYLMAQGLGQAAENLGEYCQVGG